MNAEPLCRALLGLSSYTVLNRLIIGHRRFLAGGLRMGRGQDCLKFHSATRVSFEAIQIC